jgi:hypothetical protein
MQNPRAVASGCYEQLCLEIKIDESRHPLAVRQFHYTLTLAETSNSAQKLN